MSENMHIIKLEAENVKRLKAVAIEPTGALVQITGKNGQGKTSVLDSILWALAGKATHEPKPIRAGETKARIKLDLGELTVTRHFGTSKRGDVTTRVVVEAENGAQFTSPQNILDGLLSTLSFDPLRFSMLPPKEQYEQLRDMVGLDTTDDEARVAELYRTRTETNRAAASARAAADAIQVADDTPDELVSTADIMRDVDLAEEHNRQVMAMVERFAAIEKDIVDASNRLTEKRRQLRELQLEIETEVSELQALEKDREAYPPIPDQQDVTAVKGRLIQVDDVNEAVRSKRRKAELLETASERERTSDDLTAEIDRIRADMARKLEEADMPVPGLNLANGEVTLRGLPLVQASDAEKLDVSCAIAMRQHASLKVLRIRDGSLLDDASKALLARRAKAAGYQIWMEVVDSSGTVGIVIEDGEVASVNA